MSAVARVRRLLDAARVIVARRVELAPAIVEATGLSPEGVDLAFTRHLETDATDADLAALVATAGHAERCAVVLSANVFVGALRALAVARAASEDVVVRPSRRDPTLARALVETVSEAGLRLEEGLDVAEVSAGEIHVYGRDETIADVARRARVPVRGHGAGMGVVWISSSADLGAAAAGLAADVVVFDQRGCLSPRIALVAGGEARARELAEALHAELERLEAIVPRGEVPAEERAASGRYVTTMTIACRALVGRQHAVGVAAPGAPLVLPPPYRHVHVAPSSPDAASALLGPFARAVIAVGSDDLAAARALAPPWARVSLLGEMQRPPLDGPVDLRPVTPRVNRG